MRVDGPGHTAGGIWARSEAAFQRQDPLSTARLITDQTTGTIYIPGNGSGGDTSTQGDFFRASDDNGKTWGLVYSYDSPDYPQGGGASKPAAVNGVLGLAYVASSVPAGATTGKCPCLVFESSPDEGKTFERPSCAPIFLSQGVSAVEGQRWSPIRAIRAASPS